MKKQHHFWILGSVIMTLWLIACGSPALVRPEQGAVPVRQEEVTPTPAMVATADATEENQRLPTTVEVITPVVTQTKDVVATIVPTPTTSLNPIPTLAIHRLEDYKFSEPKRIISGKAIHVVDWLPDSQRLLTTRRNIDGEGRDLIEVIDLNGQQVMSFGAWYISPSPPVIYSADEDAVMFIGYEDENPDLPTLTAVDKNLSATLIAKETESFGALSNGTNLWTINAQQNILAAPSLNGAVEGNLKNSNLSLAQIITQDSGSEDKGYHFPLSIKINPVDPNQAVMFNNSVFSLADLSTGNVTEISLGEEYSERASGKYWALDAQWSFDGRQIMVNTTVGQPITGFSNLTLLDTTTWDYRRIETPGIGVSGMSWFPDSQNVLLRITDSLRGGIAIGSLHAVNTISLDIQPLNIFPDNLVNSYGGNILWSQDGQKIVMPCVLLAEVNFDDFSQTDTQICLLEVTAHP